MAKCSQCLWKWPITGWWCYHFKTRSKRYCPKFVKAGGKWASWASRKDKVRK